jgi:DNA repair photolyase
MRKVDVVTARKGKVVSGSKFRNYDYCVNSYVGCQMGCNYCYVRFFIKDKKKPWGEFVRVREHAATQLIKENKKKLTELDTIAGKRLVLGTMTDPYQPQEGKHKITQQILKVLLGAPNPPSKVGIFTRCPLIKRDLDLIKQLPRARIHFTVTPLSQKYMKIIEPIAVPASKRFDTMKAIKDAGIRLHCCIAPSIPLLCEDTVQEYADKLEEIGVDEFFVDPFMAYKQANDAMKEVLGNDPIWDDMYSLIGDKAAYLGWKASYRKMWEAAWLPKNVPDTLPIWSDHENDQWIDMRTGKSMSHSLYGDDKELAEAGNAV